MKWSFFDGCAVVGVATLLVVLVNHSSHRTSLWTASVAPSIGTFTSLGAQTLGVQRAAEHISVASRQYAAPSAAEQSTQQQVTSQRWRSTRTVSITAVVAAVVGSVFMLQRRSAMLLAKKPWMTDPSSRTTDLALVSFTGETEEDRRQEAEEFDPLHLHTAGTTQISDTAATRYGRAVLVALISTMTPLPAMAAGPGLLPFVAEDQISLVNLLILGQALSFVGLIATSNVIRVQKEEIDILEGSLEKVYRQLRLRAQARQEYLAKEVPVVLLAPVLDHDDHGEQRAMVEELRRGRQSLKAGDGEAALQAFRRAEALLQSGGHFDDKLRFQRKAERGVAAALQQLKRTEGAIAALHNVLTLTSEIGDSTGLTDAYGVMADLYTDLNKFDEAGKFYDLYLAQMDKDSETGADGIL